LRDVPYSLLTIPRRSPNPREELTWCEHKSVAMAQLKHSRTDTARGVHHQVGNDIEHDNEPVIIRPIDSSDVAEVGELLGELVRELERGSSPQMLVEVTG